MAEDALERLRDSERNKHTNLVTVYVWLIKNKSLSRFAGLRKKDPL